MDDSPLSNRMDRAESQIRDINRKLDALLVLVLSQQETMGQIMATIEELAVVIPDGPESRLATGAKRSTQVN